MPISTTNLNKAYLAYFGRPADAAGQAYFATLEQADVIKAFDASAESQAIYGGDTASKINAIYKNLFNREAEPAGLAYWLSLVSSGRVTPAGAAFSILEGAQGTDKTAIDNKLAASEAFIKAMDTTAEIVGYSGLNAAASARGFLAAVGADAATLTAAVAGAQAAVTAATTASSNEAASDTVLKTTQDILTGTAGANTFRAVAGNTVGTQDQTTLNSSDIIDGAGGNDTMIVNMSGGQYLGGARIKNIETLQIGTNLAASSFDYNINAGSNEITEVTTVVADQIEVRNGVSEDLTINNIVKTGTAIPTLHWKNESTAVAGEVDYNYRASAVENTTASASQTQNITLENISASITTPASSGVMNIAGGIEAFAINSVGAGKNTLNGHETQQTANAVGTFVDLASGAAGLTTVTVTGAAAFGEDANVITQTTDASYGLVNRAIGADTGISNTRASASNLVSLANSVTTYDATNADGAQSVRFTPNATASVGVNVTFKGGKGNDYVEFELGNITATTGGLGDDTFAFINGTNNSSFSSTDTIDGGEGSDTFQIGVNGNAQTYTISATEFNNKGSIETLDLRGQTNTVTLSQEFVEKAQTKLVVRSDKMVQTSDTVSANDMTNTQAAVLLVEDRSVTTLDLTNLDQNTGITFLGGSGSDRLVLDNESFNQFVDLTGGTNMGNGAVVATAGDYDTLTVRDSAVLDRGDLANVRGFEGLVLVKSQAAAQFNIELTEAFVLANTSANDSSAAYGETDIRDQTFTIGTVAAANANALSNGDTVTVDITDLFANAATNTLKSSLNGRGVDLTSLAAATVTVNYIVSGVNATAGQIAAVTANNAANVTSVVGESPAVPGLNLFFTGTAADESVTLVAAGNSVNMAGGSDTINVGVLGVTGTLDGGAGTDTIVMGAGAALANATIQNVEAFTMGGAGSMTAAQYNAFANGANAGTVADVLTITTAGTIVGDADIETITFGLAASTNQITLAGATAQAINGNTGADTVITTGLNAVQKTITLGTGADILTFTSAFAADHAFNAAAGAAVTDLRAADIETINLQGGLANGVASLTMFNGATTVNLTSVTGQVNGEIILGTGGQTVNVSGAGTGTYVVAAGAGADSVSITGSAGRVLINQGSNTTVGTSATGTASLVTAVDTITGFRAGVDLIDGVAAGAGSLTTINITASTTTADLAGALSAAVNSAITLAAANWNAAGDSLVVNIASGTAAGTYLVTNAAADATFDAGAEMVVKLVGTVGVITLADIV